MPSGQRSARSAHPTPTGATIYYWPCSLLLLAPTLLLDRSFSPLSATLRLACREPFVMETDDDQRITERAVLIAPKVPRKRLAALNSYIASFYLPVEAPEYAGLQQMLGDAPYVILDFERFEHLLPEFTLAFKGRMRGRRVKALARSVVQAVTGNVPVERAEDPRVEKVRALLNKLPLEEVKLPELARQLNLSPSRLRHLFKEKTGTTISQYARWQAVWRAIMLWKQGRTTMTEIAHGAGFYDLAHFDRAFREVFGMNPLTLADRRYVRLIRCE